MNASQPPPPPPGARGERLPINPGWIRALRGSWLLTWRTQFNWQRMPKLAVALLALPLLVFITVKSPAVWASENPATGLIPAAPVNRFFKRMQDSHMELRMDQRDALAQIFSDEHAAAAIEMRDAEKEAKFDARLRRQHEAAAALEDRVMQRAQLVLSTRQYEKFQSFESGNRRRLDDQINRQQEWARTTPFYRCLIDVYFFLVLPLACVRGCGALTRDELHADTLGFLVTRPVSRARLLCVKYISQLAWLECLLLTETLLIFGAGWFRSIPELAGFLPLFLGAQVLAVAAWGALGALLGQITGRYVAIALIYGVVVEMGIGRIPTNINDVSIMRHLRTILSHNEALQAVFQWPTDNPWFSVCALAVAPILFLAAASLFFSFLEYLPASEMQK